MAWQKTAIPNIPAIWVRPNADMNAVEIEKSVWALVI